MNKCQSLDVNEVTLWTIKDVKVWLRETKFEVYCEKFASHGINGRALVMLGNLIFFPLHFLLRLVNRDENSSSLLNRFSCKGHLLASVCLKELCFKS